MNSGFLYGTNEIVIYLVFFALMLAATEAGFHLGRRSEDSTPDKTKSHVSTVEAGILGVLGLLLGFTMSMAVSRFEVRKQLVLDEANAIGTSAFVQNSSPRRKGPRSRVFFASTSMSACNTGLRAVISRGSTLCTRRPSVCRRNSGREPLLMGKKIPT